MVDRADLQPPAEIHPIPGQEHAPGSPSGHSPRQHDDDGRERDALELYEIETHEDNTSTASISSGEYRIVTYRTRSRNSTSTQQSRAPRKGVWGRIQRFWTRNVVLTVPQKNNRDHFALERTFLAYIRTSVIIAMQGVLVAQLFRLQHLSAPNTNLDYFEVGIPLAVACHCVAILVAALGAHRFFKQQNAVALGTIYAGGWELNCIAVLISLVILATFVLSLVIAIEVEAKA